MLTCFYHPDNEAIIACQKCKRSICLQDTFIFVDQHKTPKIKKAYCEMCYNEYYKNDNQGTLILLTILTVIGIILSIPEYYQSQLFGITFAEIVGWLTILSSLAIAYGIVSEYKVKKAKVIDYEVKIAKIKGINGESEVAEESLICHLCGKKLSPTDRFCQQCGRITEEEQRRQWDEFDTT